MTTQSTIDKPLAGITVVEFATMITASMAAMMMRLQGARVIKVEPTRIGDPMRLIGTSRDRMSAYFCAVNRGKESVSVNIKHPECLDAVRRLVLEEADVVLTNFRPGVMDRLGLGSKELRAKKPGLVFLNVTGFGTEGEYASLPAYDQVIQAMSGMMYKQGRSGAPDYMRTVMCDKVTSLTVAQAVTAALYHRTHTGNGQHIDVSMLETNLFFLWPDMFANHLFIEDDTKLLPDQASTYIKLTASDGALAAAFGSNEEWEAVLSWQGKEHLMKDERFSSYWARREHLDLLVDEVQTGHPDCTVAELISRLREMGIPAHQCLTPEEVIEHPQVQATGAIFNHEHPVTGGQRLPIPAARFGGQAYDPETELPAPVLGEHTLKVLTGVGMDAERVSELADEKQLQVA